MIEISGSAVPGTDDILTPDALAFLSDLQATFGVRREALLQGRRDRQSAIDEGADLDFDPATADLRAADWTVPAAPADLDDRRVEITGPVERKMMINALNSGAKVFMADFRSLGPAGSILPRKSSTRHRLLRPRTAGNVCVRPSLNTDTTTRSMFTRPMNYSAAATCLAKCSLVGLPKSIDRLLSMST